jgi:DNA-binding GntR family transcriptional regulator
MPIATTVTAPVDVDLIRLRNEFLAMPGLCLTIRQTARLLSVRETTARSLLDALCAEGLINRHGGGLYGRVVR